MKFQSWLLIIFGVTALAISPFARSWEGFGLGALATLVGAGLLALSVWEDRHPTNRRWGSSESGTWRYSAPFRRHRAAPSLRS